MINLNKSIYIYKLSGVKSFGLPQPLMLQQKHMHQHKKCGDTENIDVSVFVSCSVHSYATINLYHYLQNALLFRKRKKLNKKLMFFSEMLTIQKL